MMEYSPFVRALILAEQSRKEHTKKIIDILSDLPDDFDWDELEKLLKDSNN